MHEWKLTIDMLPERLTAKVSYVFQSREISRQHSPAEPPVTTDYDYSDHAAYRSLLRAGINNAYSDGQCCSSVPAVSKGGHLRSRWQTYSLLSSLYVGRDKWEGRGAVWVTLADCFQIAICLMHLVLGAGED